MKRILNQENRNPRSGKRKLSCFPAFLISLLLPAFLFAQGPPPIDTLSGLTDVDVTTSPPSGTDVQALFWSATLGKWHNATATGGGGGTGVFTNITNNFISGGSLNLAATNPLNGLILPQAAGAAPLGNGVIAFDTTADGAVIGTGSSSHFIVTRDATETLTNKTINGPSNTLQNILPIQMANDAGAIGDINGTWGPGLTVMVASAALTANRTITLPFAAFFPSGTRILYIDQLTSPSSAFSRTFNAQTGDTVAGGSSYTPFAGPGTVELETDGVSAWTPVHDTAVVFTLRDSTNPSKQGHFDLTGVTAGQDRGLIWPDVANWQPTINNATNQFTSAGTLDLTLISATAGFTLPTAAGAAPTTAAVVAYDSTANAIKYGIGGTGRFVASRTGSETLQNKTLDNTNSFSGYIPFTAIAAPGTASAGSGRVYEDSTSKNLAIKNDAGVVNHGVQSLSAVAGTFIEGINDDGSLVTGTASGGSTGANPTASVGLSVVNGSLTTFMRSDAAPPLDQSIAPTWTGAHNFGEARSIASGTSATLDDIQASAQTTTVTGATHVTTAKGFNKVSLYKPTVTDSSAVTIDQAATLYIEDKPTAAGSVTITNPYSLWVDNGPVRFDAGLTVGDTAAPSTGVIDAGTGFTVGAAAATTGNVLRGNGTNFVSAQLAYSDLSGTPAGANPSASVGLSAVNGSSSNYMRADGAPALSQAIAPTWTAQHIFGEASSITSGTSATLDDVDVSAQTTTVTGTTHITTAKGFNKVSLYRPTYTDSSAVTIDQGATLYIENAPLASGSVTLTNPYSLWVDNGAVRFDGGLTVGDTAAPSTGVIDASTGFTIGGAAATGSILAGNGTNFVSSSAPQITTIELGNASDTTIARAAAGQISVEGVNVQTISSTDTLTNKTLNSSTNSISDANTYTHDLTAIPNQTGGWTEYFVTGSNATTTGQTLVDITGLVSGTLSASTKYEIDVQLDVSTSASTAGCEYGIHVPAGGTITVSVLLTGSTSTSTTANSERIAAVDTASGARLLGSSQTGSIMLHGFVTTGTAATPTISIQHLKVTSGTSTVNTGSILRIRKAHT